MDVKLNDHQMFHKKLIEILEVDILIVDDHYKLEMLNDHFVLLLLHYHLHQV
jgi:hypothetical protein